MLAYSTMASLVTDYLDQIEATNDATPYGRFTGGAVLHLAEDHLLAVLLPNADPDDAMTDCLGYLQDMGLEHWLIVDQVLLGTGQNTMTILHIHPRPIGQPVSEENAA